MQMSTLYSIKTTAKTTIIMAILQISTMPVHTFDLDPVGEEVKEGVKNYKMRKFQDALNHFEKAAKDHPSENRHAFNKGATHYKMKEYDDAIKQFSQSSYSSDKGVKTQSYYNLGNSYYQKGDTLSAIKSYMRALESDPSFLPARKNLELLRKKEEEKQEKNKQESKRDENMNQNSEQANNQPSEGDQQKQANKKKQKEKTDELQNENSKKQQEEMTQEDAERILESTKQDQVKRKKSPQMMKSNKGFFW
jgi:Ca-activated chloride channel homolog